MFDSEYRTLPLSEYQEITEWCYELLKRRLAKAYLKEFFDCDDHAYGFAYLSLIVFGIPFMRVWGHIYNPATGKWIGGHFWNAMITPDDKFHFYEPIYNLWGEGEENIVIGKYKYSSLEVEF